LSRDLTLGYFVKLEKLRKIPFEEIENTKLDCIYDYTPLGFEEATLSKKGGITRSFKMCVSCFSR